MVGAPGTMRTQLPLFVHIFDNEDAHLDLRASGIGAEEAGKLAAVLGQCASLAHLDLCGNSIGDEGVGKLAAVLGQCASLAHLDLGWNEIGAEGAGRLAAVAKSCPSLTILFERR